MRDWAAWGGGKMSGITAEGPEDKDARSMAGKTDLSWPGIEGALHGVGHDGFAVTPSMLSALPGADDFIWAIIKRTASESGIGLKLRIPTNQWNIKDGNNPLAIVHDADVEFRIEDLNLFDSFMYHVPISAFDPAFWLHHSNVERWVVMAELLCGRAALQDLKLSLSGMTEADRQEAYNAVLRTPHVKSFNTHNGREQARSQKDGGYLHAYQQVKKAGGELVDALKKAGVECDEKTFDDLFGHSPNSAFKALLDKALANASDAVKEKIADAARTFKAKMEGLSPVLASRDVTMPWIFPNGQSFRENFHSRNKYIDSVVFRLSNTRLFDDNPRKEDKNDLEDPCEERRRFDLTDETFARMSPLNPELFDRGNVYWTLNELNGIPLRASILGWQAVSKPYRYTYDHIDRDVEAYFERFGFLPRMDDLERMATNPFVGGSEVERKAFLTSPLSNKFISIYARQLATMTGSARLSIPLSTLMGSATVRIRTENITALHTVFRAAPTTCANCDDDSFEVAVPVSHEDRGHVLTVEIKRAGGSNDEATFVVPASEAESDPKKDDKTGISVSFRVTSEDKKTARAFYLALCYQLAHKFKFAVLKPEEKAGKSAVDLQRLQDRLQDGLGELNKCLLEKKVDTIRTVLDHIKSCCVTEGAKGEYKDFKTDEPFLEQALKRRFVNMLVALQAFPRPSEDVKTKQDSAVKYVEKLAAAVDGLVKEEKDGKAAKDTAVLSLRGAILRQIMSLARRKDACGFSIPLLPGGTSVAFFGKDFVDLLDKLMLKESVDKIGATIVRFLMSSSGGVY